MCCHCGIVAVGQEEVAQPQRQGGGLCTGPGAVWVSGSWVEAGGLETTWSHVDPAGALALRAHEGTVGNPCPASRSGDLMQISRGNEWQVALLLERCWCHLLLSLLLNSLFFQVKLRHHLFPKVFCINERLCLNLSPKGGLNKREV